MAIVIVGLGPGHPDQLTREAWQVLSQASEIYARTARHPTLAGLPAALAVHSFDDIYESVQQFEQVYAAIAERVLALGQRPEGVVYAVPGHPAIGEATVGPDPGRGGQDRPARAHRLWPVVRRAGAGGAGLDALPNLQIADALELAARHHPPFQPDSPALVAQLYSTVIAGDVKLTLMNQYPDEHPVALVHAAGTPEAAGGVAAAVRAGPLAADRAPDGAVCAGPAAALGLRVAARNGRPPARARKAAPGTASRRTNPCAPTCSKRPMRCWRPLTPTTRPP